MNQGAKTNMTQPLWPGTQEANESMPARRTATRHTTTMISSIRLNGSTACMAHGRNHRHERSFRAYVSEVLLPTLQPDDIVVMDNLSPHKSDPTLALITNAGARVLFLPAYSPDLNPIEKMWSKLKNLLRGAEARTAADLITAIGHALAKITAQDALGWFASCGYNFC